MVKLKNIILGVIFIILVVTNFTRIDHASHSVSDTLINGVPETAIILLIGVIVYITLNTRKKFL